MGSHLSPRRQRGGGPARVEPLAAACPWCPSHLCMFHVSSSERLRESVFAPRLCAGPGPSSLSAGSQVRRGVGDSPGAGTWPGRGRRSGLSAGAVQGAHVDGNPGRRPRRSSSGYLHTGVWGRGGGAKRQASVHPDREGIQAELSPGAWLAPRGLPTPHKELNKGRELTGWGWSHHHGSGVQAPLTASHRPRAGLQLGEPFLGRGSQPRPSSDTPGVVTKGGGPHSSGVGKTAERNGGAGEQGAGSRQRSGGRGSGRGVPFREGSGLAEDPHRMLGTNQPAAPPSRPYSPGCV